MRLPLSVGLLSQHLTPSAKYEFFILSVALVSIYSLHFGIILAIVYFLSTYNTLYSLYLNLSPMSEGHANLFMSVVPANDLSSSIGLNGDQ